MMIGRKCRYSNNRPLTDAEINFRNREAVRNFRIACDVVNGKSFREVAEQHMITPARVRQITFKLIRRNHPELFSGIQYGQQPDIKWIRNNKSRLRFDINTIDRESESVGNQQ